jgi:c-di-GMP-binding flagellar brake protein YcgR
MANIISVGNKADLRIMKHRQTSDEIKKEYRTYKSKILDIIDDNTIKLSMPIEGGNIILLPLGESFEIYFYTPNGLYQSKGKVTNKLKENNIFVILFELTTPIKKNQRREFFRYHCTIDMKYCAISEYESSLMLLEEIEDARGMKLDWESGFIVDISGGGIRFTCQDEFLKDSYVLVKFNLMINHRMKEFSTIIKIISSEKI